MADPHKPQMLYVSPAYERVWGRSRQSLYEQPRSFLDAVHPQDRERVVASLQRQVAGEATSEEYRVVRPDGSCGGCGTGPSRSGTPRGGSTGSPGSPKTLTSESTPKTPPVSWPTPAPPWRRSRTTEAPCRRWRASPSPPSPTGAPWTSWKKTAFFSAWRSCMWTPTRCGWPRSCTDKYPPNPNEAHGAYRVLHTGEPEFVAEIGDEVLVEVAQDEEHLQILRGLGLRSFICVPLRTRSKMLGVVTFVYAESGRRYEARDLTLAVELARRAAVAIENAGLYHELKEADRRKDEFLATLAHELRNPLAPIRNGLQVLRLAGQENGVAGEARSMMERQLNQMVRLVDDLLDVSRITRNKLDLKKQRVELATVVQSAVETSRPLIEQAGHELSVTLPPASVYARCRPDPAGAGVLEPAQQRRQVHRTGRSHFTYRGSGRRRGRGAGAGTTGWASPPRRCPVSSRCSRRWTATWSEHRAGWASA